MTTLSDVLEVAVFVTFEEVQGQVTSTTKVAYLMNISGQETVVDVYPTNKEVLMSLPQITDDTPVNYGSLESNVRTPVVIGKVADFEL